MALRFRPKELAPLLPAARLVAEVLLGIGAAGVWGWVFMRDPDRSTRLAGVFLQFFGIALAVYGMSVRRGHFGLPGVHELLGGWYSALRNTVWSVPRDLVVVHADVVQAHWGVMPATVRQGVGNSISKRLKRAEADLLEIRAELEERLAADRKRSNDLVARIRAVETDLRRGRKQAASELEEVTTGGIPRELVGLFWIVIGIFLTGLPGELTRLLQRL